jgi:hypothetical protein
MGTTKDIFDQAAETLRDHFEWQDATYTPSGGVAVSCAVHLGQETYTEPNGYNATTWVQKKTVTGLVSDLGEPDSGGTFLIDSTTYTVTTDEPENNGRFVKVVVK